MSLASGDGLTVLMAVRNGAPFLRVAMESILNQSYRDFCFLIVDDASTDSTRDIIAGINDPRVELLPLERNIGQTAALNVGFRHAVTPWIARMDADDYSAPTRLEEQMRAVDENSDLRCVGTGIWEFRDDPARQESVILRPQVHEAIWRAELLGSGIIHGSILVHRETVLGVGGYNESYRFASDRALFLKLLRRTRAMNLQKPLVGLRRHEAQDSFSLRAVEEYIEVFESALAEDNFPAPEAAVLRRSLSYYHLFRARCLRRAGRKTEAWRDWKHALALSPQAWFRDQAGSLARDLLPKSWQAHLRDKRMGVRYENA